MDNIILGLLLMCNRTIYQLRERIDKGINLMYSSSMGSIQAAIRKLLNCGFISYEEIVDNGKYKKVYCITESGRQHFFRMDKCTHRRTKSQKPRVGEGLFYGIFG